MCWRTTCEILHNCFPIKSIFFTIFPKRNSITFLMKMMNTENYNFSPFFYNFYHFSRFFSSQFQRNCIKTRKNGLQCSKCWKKGKNEWKSQLLPAARWNYFLRHFSALTVWMAAAEPKRILAVTFTRDDNQKNRQKKKNNKNIRNIKIKCCKSLSIILQCSNFLSQCVNSFPINKKKIYRFGRNIDS